VIGDNWGFISLHRSILSWEWYDDINVCRLFIHLLLTVEYQDHKIRGMVIKRGQRLCSVKKLALETGLSYQQTRTALERLKLTNTITSTSFPKGTVITVKNYAEYQAATNKTTPKQQQNNEPSLFNNKEIIEGTSTTSPPARKKFVPPTLKEVSAYCLEKHYHVDPELFVDHYEANGWKQGRGKPIVDWKAAVRTWERRDRSCSPERTKEDDGYGPTLL